MQTKLSSLGFDVSELKADLFKNLSVNNFTEEEIRYYSLTIPADTDGQLVMFYFGDDVIPIDMYLNFVTYNEDSDIDIYDSILSITEVDPQEDLDGFAYSMFGKYIIVDGQEDETVIYFKTRVIIADEDSIIGDVLSSILEMSYYLYLEHNGDFYNTLRRMSATANNTIKENILNIPRKRIRSTSVTPYSL